MSGKTADFFDDYAHDFAAIYGTANGPIDRLINALFRRSMRLRYRKTIEGCQPAQGKTALDIGCGPGHYGIMLAKMGLAEVVGIDFAPAMIALAIANARAHQVETVCRFITGDFLSHDFNRTFDCVIAMGFMDYIENPTEVIAKTLALTDKKAFFSFPAAGGFLAWQRRRRYKNRCDLFLYSEEDIKRLFQDYDYCTTIEKISRDYFVTVEK